MDCDKPVDENDVFWMRRALTMAQFAARKNEVPVGAVVVLDHKIIGEGWNCPITMCDPSAHAEIVALRCAANYLQNYRLLNTTLYVTLEPCVMCVGAMIHARIGRLVFGADDLKTGAVRSAFSLLEENNGHSTCAGYGSDSGSSGCRKFNHKIFYRGGILAEACGKLLTDFFQTKR